MLGWRVTTAIGLACLALPALADAPDRESLRRDWHRCVRQAFSGQPSGIDKQAAERAALHACKAAEDASVAAELAAGLAEDEAGRGDGHGLAHRAHAWVASVASSVVDPVTSWIGGFGR